MVDPPAADSTAQSAPSLVGPRPFELRELGAGHQDVHPLTKALARPKSLAYPDFRDFGMRGNNKHSAFVAAQVGSPHLAGLNAILTHRAVRDSVVGEVVPLNARQ